MLATLLSLVLGAASAFGQDAYERVTSSQSDWTGEYLLVYENEEGSAVAWSGLDVAGGCADVTLNNGVITGSNLVTILVAPMEGGYSIQVNGSENDGKYIYGQSGSNALRFADVPTLNTIDYDGESAMIVSNTSVMRFNSTANQQRFRYYKETSYANQQPVQLYKKGEGGDVTETVATPTFSPEGGTYYEAQQVSIACSTADATVYYTLDGSVPTTNSMVYSSPIAISETTTVKAIGVKDGMNNSGVATATYTIQEAVTVMSIAEARALENNEYALVEGVVTYIDGRNVYIQDATAGIVLYLNSNTVPAELAMGDMVQGYGKKAVYKGLVELSGIDGTNEAEFSILSSGNELPLAVKTIEECLAGGADALQSTRVKIENAVIGAINTSGNTPLTQGESSINIYKIPALTDVEENDNVDVIAVIGYFNNAQLRVASADDVVVVEAPVTTTYSKVVNYVDIVEETQYLLVCESGSTAATAFIQNNALQTVAVTISDDNTVATMVNAEGMPCTISLGSTEGGYYVKVGDLYLNNNSGTGLSLEESAASVWNATVYNGGFILQNTSNNNRFLGGSSAEGLTYKAYANSNLGNEQYPVVYLYKEGEVTPAPMEQVEAPVFSPYAGTFTEAQEVSISCATEGATIYYTLDGTDPTTESTVYSAPITVSETTTIKAMAVKEGMQNSEVVTGTYTIEEAVSVITIAEARALENNEYARVEGVVTFVDGRNIYIQDATAGIVLYLNNNTVPAELAQGDMVQGYGKKAVYKGLVELSGIDGTNEAEFSILSSGNELPLAVKTIEECLAGGADALQSTRVLIQNAVIGAINTSGNTPLTQGESSINIYKVPALTDVEENDVVNVIAVIGYFNNPQLRVASAADVTPVSASLVVTPMMLEGFTYEQGEGPSATQTFTVSGQYLAENLTLSVEQYYEMSLTPEGDFAATLTLPTEDGNLAETTIYVRLAADLMMNTYESNVVVVNGEDEVTVALSGAVTISNAVATPTFTPAAGHYMTAQMVSIECETEGAVIHYTLDGSDPTEDSPVYAEPIEVSTDMVIKAMATKENWMSSLVASATYEILVPMTIAEARALENNEYATVEGVVTYINNRNVYVQDKTAGIVLYLNNNTVPAELALGDKVLCYGKKTVYSGLVELTGVNGGNENEFAIVSSGNTLPMKRRNIAELLADYEGDNMLQATRVMITNAIIRSINYNGNSLIVQGDNEMNIYKLPEVEGLRVGDFITVKGVVGCHNAVQLLVGSSEDVAYLHRPTINVAMNSLSGFEYNYGHGPSEAQALTVSGEGLTHYIRITPSENYEISAQGGENFMAAQSLLLMQEDGFVNGTVYVRLKEGLAIGSYNESLAITSTQADDVYVSCSGNVYDQDGPVGSDWRKIYDLSELVEGARVIVAARYDNENTDSYYAMTAVTSGKPTGVLFTSEMSGSDEVLPASITNEATTYCWTLGKIG
ncbi:MAG: chitobiase/beta-hexosaminidase C-terminal domain-containing protein, partial [Bacteroidales bacterium]|nr:chitobiase/beta-hexosaminidase C-terminal domain-containing protein [Bacteroidales bacterium]